MPPSKPSLTSLLKEHALDPKRSAADIQKQLRASGVDIDGILKSAREAVGAQVRQHYRDLSKKTTNVLLEEAVALFAAKPIAEVRKWVQEVAAGLAGPDAQVVAEPCFRNKAPEEMSEAEMRSLAAEIWATIKGGDCGKSG